MARRNKFNAQKTVVNGIRFDSKMEANRYLDLRLLEMGNQIYELSLQPKIPLMVNGQKIGDYIGDFKYRESVTGDWVIEDVKSPYTKTPVYRLKKKILATYEPPIVIKEYMG